MDKDRETGYQVRVRVFWDKSYFWNLLEEEEWCLEIGAFRVCTGQEGVEIRDL